MGVCVCVYVDGQKAADFSVFSSTSLTLAAWQSLRLSKRALSCPTERHADNTQYTQMEIAGIPFEKPGRRPWVSRGCLVRGEGLRVLERSKLNRIRARQLCVRARVFGQTKNVNYTRNETPFEFWFGAFCFVFFFISNSYAFC